MITTCDDMCWLSPHVLELSGLGVGVQCRGPFLLLSFVVLPHARGTARGTVSNSTMLSCLLLCCVCSDFLLQCDAMCVSMPLCVAMLLLVTISMVWVSPLSPRRSQTNTWLQTEWTMPGIAWSLASCFGGRFWKLNQRHSAKGSSIVSNYYWQCFTVPHLCQQCIRTYGGAMGYSMACNISTEDSTGAAIAYAGIGLSRNLSATGALVVTNIETWPRQDNMTDVERSRKVPCFWPVRHVEGSKPPHILK